MDDFNAFEIEPLKSSEYTLPKIDYDEALKSIELKVPHELDQFISFDDGTPRTIHFNGNLKSQKFAGRSFLLIIKLTNQIDLTSLHFLIVSVN